MTSPAVDNGMRLSVGVTPWRRGFLVASYCEVDLVIASYFGTACSRDCSSGGKEGSSSNKDGEMHVCDIMLIVPVNWFVLLIVIDFS